MGLQAQKLDAHPCEPRRLIIRLQDSRFGDRRLERSEYGIDCRSLTLKPVEHLGSQNGVAVLSDPADRTLGRLAGIHQGGVRVRLRRARRDT